MAPVLAATVYQHTALESEKAAAGIEPGARLFINGDGDVSPEKLSDELAAMLESEMRALSLAGRATGDHVFETQGSAVKVFVETLLPPVQLVVFGAGHDALPIVELARGLGWQTEVVDPQTRAASRARFAIADRVILASPQEVGAQVTITPRTLTLLMSHNYSHDLALLKLLLTSPARYIGVMGPRKRTERMLSELSAEEASSWLDDADLARFHSPVGLDIGANAPAEIALSIVAEMRAVIEGRLGGMLRERRGSIYGRPEDGEGVPLAEEQVHQVAAA